MKVILNTAERDAGQMDAVRCAEAIEALRTDGYIVVEHAIHHEPLDSLREKMDRDTQVMIDAQHWGGAGRKNGHLQQGAPPKAPYIFSEVVANPFAIQITKGVLGEGIFNSFYNGNTN